MIKESTIVSQIPSFLP